MVLALVPGKEGSGGLCVDDGGSGEEASRSYLYTPWRAMQRNGIISLITCEERGGL